MAGRERTTKKLAKRINRDYFKLTFPMPRMRRLGWILLTCAGLVWLSWYAFARNSAPYSAGPIRSSHAVFSQNCGACHVTQAAFTRKVTDPACLSCHDGPVHQAKQTFTPACGSCHMEHQGMIDIARTSTGDCTQCHADLKTNDGSSRYAAHIESFTKGHPEFAVLREGKRDPGTIKFNHKVHLREQLRGPQGNVQLQCADCHRASDGGGAWPNGKVGEAAAESTQPMMPVRHVSLSAYMRPINYFEHCSGCHPLAFDKRFNEPAPHKKPQIVQAYVLAKFTGYIAAHPEELKVRGLQAQVAERPLPPMPRNAQEWITQRMSEADQLLWTKSCKECHALSYPDRSDLPRVTPVALTNRWLLNARFDHRAHQSVECESCHQNTRTSTLTSDVLLPAIASCQACHRPNVKTAAEARCFECHDYHDWTKEKPVNGKYTIHQFVSRLEPLAIDATRR